MRAEKANKFKTILNKSEHKLRNQNTLTDISQLISQVLNV